MSTIRVSLVALACAVAVAGILAFASTAPAAPAKKLAGTVGPGFTITLKKGSAKVKTLPRGVYSITVTDRSGDHDFRLFGPGLGANGKLITGVDFVGKRTRVVTLRKGTYRYVCDPHEDEMRGSFRVT